MFYLTNQTVSSSGQSQVLTVSVSPLLPLHWALYRYLIDWVSDKQLLSSASLYANKYHKPHNRKFYTILYPATDLFLTEKKNGLFLIDTCFSHLVYTRF